MGALSAGCGAPAVDPVREARVLPPAGASATPSSSASASAPEPPPAPVAHSLCVGRRGAAVLENVTFSHDGRLCGCFDGLLYCDDASEPRCFWGSTAYSRQWYELGTGPGDAMPGTPLPCTCGSPGDGPHPPTWSCIQYRELDNACGPSFTKLAFDLGSAVLPARALVHVERIARKLNRRGADPHVTLEGHADPSEGPNAASLAWRRAEAVRAALLELGVKGRRIRVTSAGTKPVPGPTDCPTFIINPGAAVVYWMEGEFE